MIHLSDTTEYVRVRRYRLVPTEELRMRYKVNIAIQNDLYNYALKYLEKTYGYKHLGRKYPDTRTKKIYVIKDQILPKYIKEKYNLKRWNNKIIGLHSQAAHQFLLTMITNFGEYRKTLMLASKMSKQDKEGYKNNVHNNNPKHKSWYRKGSLNYLHSDRSTRCISLPSNGQAKIMSAHFIKIQDYGIIQVVENLANMRNTDIVTTKIKRKSDGKFELQVVFKTVNKRKEVINKIGADWNMKDNKAWHTSEDEELYINKDVSDKADELENKINKLKSQRDLITWLPRNSKRIVKLNKEIRYWNSKRSHILTDEYNAMAKKLLSKNDLVAIENLDAKEMRKRQEDSSNSQNRAKNRKLAKIKPYEMEQLIIQMANRLGKTVILVDSYKTSQVEYGTEYQEKHSIDDREWTSKYTGKTIKRDLNASKNILAWALNPKEHIKYKESLALQKEGKIKKAIRPQSLIAIN
ncbi:RNA-guided endonuclease TnpB family protein [Ligilactobacillus salivarius]|uniref:Transposase n=1 Tax=Ligilactobacillus salivarius TaxID=1624 RepID=A0A2U2MCD2_9LACO|nr:RNA-guided endonuclease TnpB family protein [Ligilactobacillus salivarius]PWG54504.1 transposase [Ligilactobacillus salivarius]